MLFSKQTPAAGGTDFAQFDAAWCYDGNGYILNDTGTSLDVRIGASGSVQTLASGATLQIKLVFSMAELYVRRTDQGTTQVTVEAQVGTGSAGGGGSTADMAVIAAASTAAHNADAGAHGAQIAAAVAGAVARSIPVASKTIQVSFVCDDGTAADYTQIAPIFTPRSVPCNCALIAGVTAGQIYGGATTTAYHLELQNTYGWEMLSHSKTHAPLGDLTTDAEVVAELDGAKSKLIGLGFAIKSLVLPYGSTSERVRRIAANYYEATATSGGDSINSQPIAQYGISRYSLGYGAAADTLDYAKAPVLAAQKAGAGWVVYAIHPGSEGHTATTDQNIADLLDWLSAQGIPVVKFSDGFAAYKNQFQIGDAPARNSDPSLISGSSLSMSGDGRVIHLRNAIINQGDSCDYGFQRFGLRVTLQGVTFTAGRFVFLSGGTTARFAGNAGSNSSNYFAVTEMHRGTGSSSYAMVIGPAYAVGGARNLWCRWKSSTGSGWTTEGALAFIGLRAEAFAHVGSMQDAVGFLVDATNTYIKFGKKVAGVWTTSDTAGLVSAESGRVNIAVELTATEANFFVGGTLVGSVTHSFTSSFSPTAAIEGPTTGSTDSSIGLLSCEWGYGVPIA